ncbi:MAG: hypothetical protein KBC30_11275 [Planctomycetes bacterium]|nr:hypothetical protein [Planctomycetota bacterium]
MLWGMQCCSGEGKLLWGFALGSVRIKIKRLALFFYAKFLICCCFSYF